MLHWPADRAHLMVVDELKVLRNYASQELQQTLDKELQTAQQHLQLAKHIALKIKDRPSERVSRRPDSESSASRGMPADRCGNVAGRRPRIMDVLRPARESGVSPAGRVSRRIVLSGARCRMLSRG